MARSVEEWIGKTDDEMAPPRVRLRVLMKYRDCCANCGTFIVGTFTCDHIIAIINGGENRERNLQPLCRICTRPKDAADVAEKSYIATLQKKRHGQRKPSRMPGSRNSKWKRALTADGPKTVRRE